MTSERDIIRDLKNCFPVRPPVEVGIGDDGAVLRPGDRPVIVVTDMLLDGVHFDLSSTSPELVGRKAVAVNLSDLAAMGCWPTAAFISIAVPKSIAATDTFLSSLYDGMQALSDQFEFTIAGGDTNTWHGPFAINVCLTGSATSAAPVLRSGAKPGDVLMVTGPLGGSLPSGHHLTFEPHLQLSKWLLQNTDVHAMMDISDGLSIDLHRMVEASGTGAILDADAIPISPHVDAGLSADQRLKHAMSDGEDFELLIAVSAADAKSLASQTKPHSFVRVGEVTESNDVLLKTGDTLTHLPADGWQHLSYSESR